MFRNTPVVAEMVPTGHEQDSFPCDISQSKSGPWRGGRKGEVGGGEGSSFSILCALKPGFACWKNVFLAGWFWFWRKVFSLSPPTSSLGLFHMFISCLPRPVREDWTWDLSCNSFFYVSTLHTWRQHYISLSSCGRICFLLFPVGVRRRNSICESCSLVNLRNSGGFYKEFAKLCRDIGRIWSF